MRLVEPSDGEAIPPRRDRGDAWAGYYRPADEVRVVDPDTGGAKGSKRARFDLLPFDALWAAARSRPSSQSTCRERNWEKGLPGQSLISSQFRHLLGYTSGVSDDTPLYNLTANLWNAIVLLETYMRVGDGEMDEGVLDIEKKYFSLEDE